MATIDLNHVQFWAPPPKPLLRKQGTASSLLHSMSKSLRTTNSRNQPIPLYNKADQVFKCNDRSTPAIAAAQRQGDDSSAAEAQGRNTDDETDDDFPSIEELVTQVSREGISTRRCRNSEDIPRYPQEPILDTSESRPSSVPSRLDDRINSNQGTRDKPVILEDDESDTLNPEVTAVFVSDDDRANPPFETSKELQYDVEDECFIDNDLCPIPSLEQEGLASMPAPASAQDQPNSLHHWPRPSQAHSSDGTIRCTSEEPGSHSLPTPLDENSGGGSEETVSEFEKDLLQAFGGQEKPSQGTTPGFPRPHRTSTEPLQLQIDQEVEELKGSTPLHSRDQEEPRERQEVVIEAIRKEEDDGDNEEREPQGEKHQRQENEEISSDIHHHSESSERSHNTSDEDDEDPQPAKRQKLSSAPIVKALTPPRDHSSAPRLLPLPTTQPEMDRPRRLSSTSSMQVETDDAQPQTRWSTFMDNKQPDTPSRSPSAIAESPPVAEYREWPFQGFLKRVTIGNQTIYNLEFALPPIPEHFNLSLGSGVLGAGFKELSAEAVVSHRAVTSCKLGKELTKEQESLLAKMIYEDKTWVEIGRHFPGHKLQLLKENFFTKQGGRPRRRGRKPGVKVGGMRM